MAEGKYFTAADKIFSFFKYFSQEDYINKEILKQEDFSVAEEVFF